MGICFVLQKFDDCDYEFGVSVPGECVVDSVGVLNGEPFVDFLGKICQEDERNAFVRILKPSCKIENLAVSRVVHTDDHVDAVISFQNPVGLCGSRRPDEFRGIAQVQIDVLPVDLRLDLSVLFEDEGVIVAADHQDLADSVLDERLVVCGAEFSQADRLFCFHLRNIDNCCLPGVSDASAEFGDGYCSCNCRIE